MSAKSRVYGHPVIHHSGKDVWRWDDTGEAVTRESEQARLCPRCGKPPTREGYDACLGHLPGISGACCGHGFSEDVYVQFENGDGLSGENALAFFKSKTALV